ncbi:MAG: exosortase/archaeosortase family protein [Verrucomicrobia bacterium]|nr:exosortase/archaeosortase family protein [Kiritimatiellia bacterium]MCP5489107.1 exosortase/archaeosortase family protein [Verrucomicrobiota bacterium]
MSMTGQRSPSAEVWNAALGLAVVRRADLIRCLLASLMVGGIFLLFHFQGNTTDVKAFGRSSILWMFSHWTTLDEYGEDYSHGWLIPLVSIGLVYWKRRELARVPKSVSMAGLMVVVMGLLMHWLGAKAQQTRFSLFGLIVLLWGIPFYFYGWRVAKILAFPCAFLIFCIPLNFLDTITFPLRVFATALSSLLLNGIGIPVERVGTTLNMLSAGEKLDVAAACSGIRSLVALTAITSVYAYVTQRTLARKWLLFACSIPLAIIANVVRLTTIGIVAESFGVELAVGLYHDWSGFITFGVAISLMIALGNLINSDLKEGVARWKHAIFNPS